MGTNDTNQKIIYKELCYRLYGLLFELHNTLGRYCRERQYGDALQTILTENLISFTREKPIPLEDVINQYTNKADFVIEDKIVLELKSKPLVTKEDYSQMQRYLQAGGYKLGLLVNFRNKYLKPIRIIRLNS